MEEKASAETKENILRSAKQEFLEKGYMKASLRSICRNAGVTTGALYFFFDNKEDLFDALLQRPVNHLYELMMEHYTWECNVAKEKVCVDDHQEDYEAMKKIMAYMYQYFDEFELAVLKSQGSKYENTIEKFVAVTEKHYSLLAKKLYGEEIVNQVDSSVFHWIAHVQVSVYEYLIVHRLTPEQAKQHVLVMGKFLIGGWNEVFSALKQKKQDLQQDQ